MSSELANIYPEIVRAGGLPRALREMAAGHGMDLPPGMEDDSSSWSARIESPRGACFVTVAVEFKCFHVEIHRLPSRILWVSGSIPDLDMVARLIVLWLQGASASELGGQFGSVRVGELADVARGDDLAAAQWRSVLSDEIYLNERPLLEAVYRLRAARRLFPVLSHGVLKLSYDSGRVGGRELRIVPLRDGGYRVEDEEQITIAVLNRIDAVGSLIESRRP